MNVRLQNFMISASIRFENPAKDAEGRLLDGAYQNFGVLAESWATAVRLVEDAVTNGRVEWSDSQIRVMDEMELRDPDFERLARKAKPNSIWYESGMALYSDSDPDDDGDGIEQTH